MSSPLIDKEPLKKGELERMLASGEATLGLSERHEQIREFILKFKIEHPYRTPQTGYLPTVREIADWLDISPTVTHKELRRCPGVSTINIGSGTERYDIVD